MSLQDLEKWNAKYADPAAVPKSPSPLIESLDEQLPRRGSALDLAGGAGRHALWLARRGLQTTLVDISPAGLALARKRAEAENMLLETVARDLVEQGPPPGCWDVVLSAYFLHRPLLAAIPDMLLPAGYFVLLQPTVRNLERHQRPPQRFLLEEGEAPSLFPTLETVLYREGWLAENRHEALLVMQKRADTTASDAR